MFYTIHTNSGAILNSGECNEEAVLLIEEGCSVIFESSDPSRQYVLNGKIYDYTADEISRRNNIPYGHKWQMPERIVVQDLTDEQIAEYLAAEARKKREFLLYECDWTQAGDQPESTKSAWAGYRQELRDITLLQSGFPRNINWPTKPL